MANETVGMSSSVSKHLFGTTAQLITQGAGGKVRGRGRAYDHLKQAASACEKPIMESWRPGYHTWEEGHHVVSPMLGVQALNLEEFTS